MKTIKILFVSLICLLNFVGCKSNQDGLGKYRRNGQLIDLTYQEFDQKLLNDESFVFFLKREGCHACKDFYPVVGEYLSENKDTKIYTLNYSDLEAIDAITVASYYLDTLGNQYYEENGYSSITLYTPSVCKILKGEFVDAEIGVISKEKLSHFYQDNYISLDSFYSFNRKVQKKETLTIFISKNGDQQYDDLLRDYFVNNTDLKGNYLSTKKFSESDNVKLLNRINYYLGEEKSIASIPEYFLLQYENGTLVNYVEGKYDASLLNALYNK